MMSAVATGARCSRDGLREWHNPAITRRKMFGTDRGAVPRRRRCLFRQYVRCDRRGGDAAVDRWEPWPQDPRVERHLLVMRAREGFMIFDHRNRSLAALDRPRGWIAERRLRWQEDVLDGIEACLEALAGLYRDDNSGKRLIRLV